MRWNSWKWWRFGRATWEKGSKPQFCTDGAGKWIPLAFGIWFLLYPTPTGERITVASTVGFELGDTIIMPGRPDAKIIALKTETQLVLRPNTLFWRAVAWARSVMRYAKGAPSARA